MNAIAGNTHSIFIYIFITVRICIDSNQLIPRGDNWRMSVVEVLLYGVLDSLLKTYWVA